MNKDLKIKTAFTLAEVLITLGIIGTVSAMTIPTLVKNYQEKSWNTSASEFEQRFGEALKIMNVENNLTNLATTEKFVEQLQKHIRIIKTCDHLKIDQCFSSEIHGATRVVDIKQEDTFNNDYTKPLTSKDIISSNELGQSLWGTNTMGLQFANGVSAILAYNPKCNADPNNNNSILISGGKGSITFTTDCVAMVYDVSSNSAPNVKGKDIRTSSSATIDTEGCQFKIGSTCVTGFVPQAYMTYGDCLNSRSEYGIKRCSAETDYWAGAVKACGGTNKMLNSQELTEVASFIYGTTVTLRETTEGTYNSKSATSIGFPSSADNTFYVWSGVELDKDYSRNRTFSANSTYGEGPNTPDERTNSATLVLCKK